MLLRVSGWIKSISMPVASSHALVDKDTHAWAVGFPGRKAANRKFAFLLLFSVVHFQF